MNQSNHKKDPSSQRENTVFCETLQNRDSFSDDDLKVLARGHQFLANLQEDMKYTPDLSTALSDSLEHIADYFHLDRIAILETDLTNGTNTLSYQWNSNPENTLVNYFQTMAEEEIYNTCATYDRHGYIEINPTHHILTSSASNTRIIKEFVLDVLLGTQLWIPTLKGGKYSGAVFFDKYDTTPYTLPEKFLLSEVVNALAVYIDRLNAENANRAKSDFLSTMSHEIRTPMNAIVGMAEVALREDMSPSIRKCLKTIQSSAFGLLTLINDILDYSKIEAGKLEIVPEKFYTLSLLNDMYEIAKARNNEKLALNLHLPENLPSVLYGDIVRIKQVMINFCTNAIKYTDEGSVDITVKAEKISKNQCNFIFSVADTGIGIRKEDLCKLFKQYGQVDTTTNHHKEGTGLGLMISRQLIEKMDGKVSVKSEYGKGSTFSFHIPLEVIDWSAAGTLENYHYDEPDFKQQNDKFTAPDVKVLIVDDTPLNLMVAKALFRPIGMMLETAESGFEALAQVENTTYDVILMDHFMPGMDGVETTKKIRAMEGNPNQHIPIIAMTADAMAGVKEHLISSGMNDFIAKPILIEVVYHVLKKWLPAEKIILSP